MSFVDAVKTCLSKYVDFNGRARRSEYWYFVLFTMIVSIVASTLDKLIGINAIAGLASLALLLPELAVTVRRLHDIGKRWTWILMSLIPVVGWIFMLVYECKDSEPGENQFGPNPKETV